MPVPVHDSWKNAGLAAALGVALAWGVGFGALDAAWFTLVDQVYPVGAGHLAVALVLAVPHALLAAAAVLAVSLGGRLVGTRGPALRMWAGPWLLLLVLGISVWRDHALLLRMPGALADSAVTLAIFAGAGAGWLLSSAWAAGRPASISRGLLLGTAALLALVCVVRVGTSSPPKWEPPADAVTAADVGPIDDTGLRVLVVGLDGGTWKTLDPLRERGLMPNLDGLCRRGVTADLKSDLPTYSPNLWTSIATGKTLEKHGIPTHVYSTLPFGMPPVAQRPDGMHYLTKVAKYAIRAADRAGVFSIGVYGADNLHARRYWDIAGEFGMRSVTLEWYVTHPAEVVDGVEVSDRFHLLQGEGLRRAVFPDTLAPLLEGDIVTQPEAMEGIARFADTNGLDAAGRARLVEDHPQVFETLAHELGRDLTTRSLVGKVFPMVPDWRVGSVYYRGMDGSHHVAWLYREKDPGEIDDPAAARLRPIVDRYTAFCDSLLAAPLALANDTTVVIALSDHGWDDARTAHARKPDGFFVMAGGPVKAGGERGAISVYDVAPTILALLGIPVPEDMDGHPAVDMVEPAFWDRHPVRTVPSFEHPYHRRGSPADAAADDEFLEQLRALGYVGN